MTLIELFLLLLAIYGLTFTFVHSNIMSMIGLRQLWEKNKFLKELFHCAFCTGFHFGYSYGLICYLSKLINIHLFYILTIPFACSSFCYMFDRIVIFIDNKVIEQEKPLDKTQ